MKEGWEVKELGSLANFVRGPFGGSLKKDCFVKEGIAVYEQQHAIYNQFEEIRYFITDEKFNELKRFELSPNDLIMSCSGTMGKVAIVPKEIKKGIINQALLKITCSKFLYNRFLELYMKSVTFQELLNKDAKGAAIKNVASVKDLKAMPIPIPPLQEQQAIVEKLDTAFAYIDQAKEQLQRNIENAKQLFQSQLNQIFSQKGDDWEEKKLGEVCLKITDGSHNPPKGIELSSHLMLSSKNILDDKITYDNPRK
jgi:type I restriction enzyme S subunit